MKILELTSFSAGVCGVWNRVREESIRLARMGHEVRIFSSDKIKGSGGKAESNVDIEGVFVQRFRAKKLGGESFMNWSFEDEARKFRPDAIVAHSYRHPHTTKALRLKGELGCKVFLVTHAPFGNDSRGILSASIVSLYDRFLGKKIINQFDKIIAITKWEQKYLQKLWAKKEKMVIIPNGIPEEFFELKNRSNEESKILFLGRVSPVKDLETLIRAAKKINSKTLLEIVGPYEENYLKKLKKLVKELNVEENIVFLPPIYNLNEKIKKIDSARVFVLPSKREGMPQSLIEAMAREKVVIASDNQGSKELIKNGKNGYLFKKGNVKELAKKIELALQKNEKNKEIRKEAKKSVEKYNWKQVMGKIEEIF